MKYIVRNKTMESKGFMDYTTEPYDTEEEALERMMDLYKIDKEIGIFNEWYIEEIEDEIQNLQ